MLSWHRHAVMAGELEPEFNIGLWPGYREDVQARELEQ